MHVTQRSPQPFVGCGRWGVGCDGGEKKETAEADPPKLQPKVISLDGDGRAISTFEEVSTEKEKQTETVTDLNWAKWFEHDDKADDTDMANRMLRIAMDIVLMYLQQVPHCFGA